MTFAIELTLSRRPQFQCKSHSLPPEVLLFVMVNRHPRRRSVRRGIRRQPAKLIANTAQSVRRTR